jgi:23S rRNA maturation mini-RNase III
LVRHNQRLEFLGDAVLGLVLTRELYEKFPLVSEGPLTKARAQMINRRTLAEQARRLELQNDLILSRGEEANLGRSRASALADGFEALIGAVFLDGGFDAAGAFVLRSFREAFGELTSIPTLENPKGELQEIPGNPASQVARRASICCRGRQRPGPRSRLRMYCHAWRRRIGPGPGQKQKGGRKRSRRRRPQDAP